MSIFESARALLRPAKPHTTKETFPIPFGLKPDEWNALKTLPSHLAWPAFLAALDSLAKLHGEMLLQSSKPEALHFLRGSVAGIRKAATLINVEMQKETNFARDKQRAADVSRSRERSNSVLFGTPGWRSKSDSDA